MASGSGAAVCANTECGIAESGKCVEGLAPEQCPHYGRSTSSVPEAPSSGDVKRAEDVPRRIGLPAGELLETDETASVLRSREARVVALVGPRDTGKTSVIAALYDLFQNGAVDGYRFAGSRTLRAFERACHDTRAASRRMEPETARTPLGAAKFYQLALVAPETQTMVELVLADRAGEQYRSVADDPSIAASFAEIDRADVVTLLVDGRRLLDLGARHNLRSEIELTVQGFIDGDVVAHRPRAAVVLTKLDLINAAPDGGRVEADFEGVVGSIRQLFGSAFSDIGVFRIAASPGTTTVQRGHGLADLLRFWMKTQPLLTPEWAASAAPIPERAMARLNSPEGR